MAAVAAAAILKFNSSYNNNNNNNNYNYNYNNNINIKNNVVGLFRSSNSIRSSSITASSCSRLQFPPSHRLQYHHPHPHGPHPTLGIRCLSESNPFSLKRLKEHFECYPLLLTPYPKTCSAQADHREKIKSFHQLPDDECINITLQIYVQEDDDGMVKRKLRNIDSIYRKWHNIDTLDVDNWDRDRQHFVMCLLKDTSKCLLENKDRWICGFSNVSNTDIQLLRALSRGPEPLDLFDLSPTENAKHKIGCLKLFMKMIVKKPIISFNYEGIHSRQDVEAILEQCTTLEGKLLYAQVIVSEKSFELDKEKVDKLQGYHHVNYV